MKICTDSHQLESRSDNILSEMSQFTVCAAANLRPVPTFCPSVLNGLYAWVENAVWQAWPLPPQLCPCHTNIFPFYHFDHTNFDLLVNHIMFWPHQLWKPSSAHVYMVTVWQASPRTHQHKHLEIVTISGKNFLGDYLELKNHMDHGTDTQTRQYFDKKLTVFKKRRKKTELRQLWRCCFKTPTNKKPISRE